LITTLPKQEATHMNDASHTPAETAALARVCDKIRAQQRVGEITSAEAGQMLEDAHAQYDMHLRARTS
jgi:hypothetical protein